MLTWKNGGLRGQEDQHALTRSVVQLRPGHFDLFQLAEDLAAEVFNGVFIMRLDRVRPELAVYLPPGEP